MQAAAFVGRRRLFKQIGTGVLLSLTWVWESAAAPVTLQDLLINVNGTTYASTAVPGLDTTAFDVATGLGVLTLTFTTGVTGSQYVTFFFDHHVAEPFFDEYGAASGTPQAGVTWQIDEPGWGDANRVGTIYDNALTNALDNTNHVPGATSNASLDCGANDGASSPDASCNNDVSLALGFTFLLAPGAQPLLTVSTSQTRPGGAFFLEQRNPAGAAVFVTGSVDVTPASPVPEPGTLLLLGIGLTAAASRTIRRKVRPL